MHYTTTHNFAKNDSKQPTFWNQFPPLCKQNHDYASEIASLRNWTRTRRNPTSCPFQQQNRENNSTGIKTRSGSSWLQRSLQVMAHRKVSADFAYTRTRHPCRRHLEKSIPFLGWGRTCQQSNRLELKAGDVRTYVRMWPFPSYIAVALSYRGRTTARIHPGRNWFCMQNFFPSPPGTSVPSGEWGK